MTDFQVGQVVKLKKPHPCGGNLWKIIRVGADFRIQCQACKRGLMIPRVKFEKRVKKILTEKELNDDLS